MAEVLEPRVVLAGVPVISEFQAINVSTLQDEDSEFSDWIEIRNSGTDTMDLNGFYLTDDPANLTKWKFPSTNLQAGDEIIVFASDKDRAIAGSELHANFKLAGNGEFLALVNPDGTTISQQFDPYPEQFEDQSYGLVGGRENSVLLDGNLIVKTFVPTDGSLGLNWTQPNFSDTTWASGLSPVGYEQLTPPAVPVYGPEIISNLGAQMQGVNSSAYVRIGFNVTGDLSRFDELELSARYDDGFIAYLNGTRITEQNVPLDATWNSAASGEYGAVGGRIPTQLIDVSGFVSALQSGQNVLAIHGMNVDAADNDFFFNAGLTAIDVLPQSTQFFTSPTPGAVNDLPAAPAPIIEGGDGIFFGEKSVTLSLATPLPTLEIRYTLDGNEPTTRSTLYTRPISLSESAMLQAKTFDTSATPAYATSNATSGTFFALNEDLRNRTSDLPIVILDSLGQSLPSTSSTTLRPINVLIVEQDRTTGRASLAEPDIDYIGRGGVRDRGSSSSGLPKPNMAFETWGATGTDQDDDSNVRILGMNQDSDYVFYAGTSYDTTLIHNQFAFDLSNQIGQWAPDYRNVEVYFNRRDGVISEADYHGVYAITEKITGENIGLTEIDPSVTATPEEAAPGEPNISGGYVWKVDRGDPGESAFSAGGHSLNWVEPKSPNSRRVRDDQKATPQQEDWVQDHLGDVTTAIRTTTIDDPNGYSSLVDIESFTEHHLLNVLTFNVDAFRLSGYLHKDQDGPVKYGPVWDFDRALNSTDGRDADPFVWRSATGDRGTDFFNYGPWYSRLFDEPGFWQAYIDQYEKLRLNEFSDANLHALVDKLADEIRESQAREETDCSVCNHIRARGGWENELIALKGWLSDRTSFMDSNFARPPSFELTDVVPRTETGLNVTAGTQVKIAPFLDVNNDTPLVSGENGVADAKFFVPIDDSLGDSWAQLGFNDAAWQSGKMGVGFGTSTGFEDNYTTEISPRAKMEGATNIMMRIPFNVDSFDGLDQLVLQMKYDDGFMAYLNGEEVLRINLREDPAWNSRASSHSNRDAIQFEDFDISKFKDNLNVGQNMLAIRGFNSSATSNDLLFQASLVKREVNFQESPTGNVYYTTDGSDPRGADGNPTAAALLLGRGQPFTVTKNMRVTTRNFDTTNRGTESNIVETDWSAPTTLNFIVDQPRLAITEINYNPAAPNATEAAANAAWNDESFEFIEIQNIGTSAADLTGVTLSDGVNFDFSNGLSVLQPGARAVVVSDLAAFTARYGVNVPVAGQFEGSLNNNGEDIDLKNGTGEILFSVRYGDSDPWPASADGAGATLELVDPATPLARQSKYYSWRGSSELGGTPGQAGAGPKGIVINEILANTNAPANGSDSIELFNTASSTVDISGWFLSDSGSIMNKYAIPAGTLVGPGGYVVFTEADFNQGENGFALSGTNGDTLWLSETNASGNIVGIADTVSFGGTDNGESIGRVPNGTGRLVPMTSTSLGNVNSAPRVGPVVITEINFNPAAPSAAALALYPNLTPSDLEFVEIHNPSSATVNLTDWRIRGGVQLDFADGLMLLANGTVVAIPFDVDDPENSVRVAAFRTHYGIGANVKLVGGYQGQLGNSDDEVRLLQSGIAPVDDPDANPRFVADEVLYDDLAPWPIQADGTGSSLQRRGFDLFGNASSSWLAGTPNPGIAEVGGGLRGDFNGDNAVNAIDIDLLSAQIRSANPDSNFDLNGDGMVTGGDHETLVHGILGTTFGDSNLDGRFDSGDLVAVFQAGQYEDAIAMNSTWASGDWNGDGDFTTRDLVVAFQDGGYVAAAIPLALVNVDGNVGAAIDRTDSKDNGESNIETSNQGVEESVGRKTELDAAAHDQIFASIDGLENDKDSDDDENAIDFA